MDEVYGNLFQQAEEAVEILKKKYLQASISIKKLHREEELEYPEVALREAIVNAIVHRDYSDVHTQFKVYPDHLSLWNNGELTQRLTVEKLKKKHSSFPKNELIADVFYKAAYI
jgi:ATP-dependent DNA helicase RecG